MKPEDQDVASFIKGIFWLLVVFVVVAVIGRIFLFEVAQTNSYSMVPNLLPGDTFLVFTRGILGPGESVVCSDPENPESMIVSRIMGVPESTISMSKNNLHINGRQIQHSFFGTPVSYEDTTGGESQTFTVMIAEEKVAGHLYSVALSERHGKNDIKHYIVEDGFYLLGDNRDRARDSRNFGDVAVEDCIGTPFMIIWPGPDSIDFRFKNRFLQWIH